MVTVRFNGKLLAERTTLNIKPTATFEQVARARLQAALGAADAAQYATMPLSVSVFPTADHRLSEKTAAAIIDPVAGSFTLGYPHVLLAFSKPVYGCARRPATGVDGTAMLMDAARAEHSNLCLPVHCAPKEEGGALNFELTLYNAILEQCADETRTRALATPRWRRRSPSRPRSRGRAPRASRRASPRCSSLRPSARLVLRRSGRGATNKVQCGRQASLAGRKSMPCCGREPVSADAHD